MTREEYQKEYLESFIREEYDPIVWGENLFTDNVREVFRAGIQCADTMPKPELVDLSKVWHDAKEEPEKGKSIISIGATGVSAYKWVDEWRCDWVDFAEWSELFIWAYVYDLLPKGGE